MPEPNDLARLAAQHLESLRLAGVQWLPAAPPLTSQEEPTPTPAPVQQKSLFGEPHPEPVAAPPTTLTPEQRRHELTVLAEQVSACERCPELTITRTQTVFGVGPIDPEVCFLGEAPGREEDRKGEPFVGPAGQLLNRIIAAMGFQREEVFICNILRCLPPGDRPGSVRPPNPDEASNCRGWLDATLDLVRPKVMVAMGASATKYLLNTAVGITKLRGQWREYRGRPVMCTFHPSYLLRQKGADQDRAKRDVWEDMKQVLARLGRPVPGAK
jgi:DNA polymerase